MRKILSILFITSLVIISCGKVKDYSNDFSSAAFINATPFSTPAPGIPTTNLRIFVDTLQKTSSNVVYTGSSGYLSIAPGTRKIEVRSSLDLLTNYAVSATENFITNTASSFFIYDTIDNATGRVKLLRLNDTLTIPPTGFIKVRFVPLAVNAPVMDVTFLRTTVTPNDSITFFNRAYVGSNPNISALSAFTTIPIGSYSIKLKSAGTQTVLLIQPLSLTNLTGTGNITGISSIFATGTAKGQPLRIGLFRHYP